MVHDQAGRPSVWLVSKTAEAAICRQPSRGLQATQQAMSAIMLQPVLLQMLKCRDTLLGKPLCPSLCSNQLAVLVWASLLSNTNLYGTHLGGQKLEALIVWQRELGQICRQHCAAVVICPVLCCCCLDIAPQEDFG